MRQRSSKALAVAAVLIGLAGAPAFPQAEAPQAKKTAATFPAFSYEPGGRRDPFKDLFGGTTVREKKTATGLPDLMIEDVVIMGIVAAKGKSEAIISLAQGFPITIREGDRVADGFVLAIREGQVIFRKTVDSKGIPLAKPRDIIKEITQEER